MWCLLVIKYLLDGLSELSKPRHLFHCYDERTSDLGRKVYETDAVADITGHQSVLQKLRFLNF